MSNSTPTQKESVTKCPYIAPCFGAEKREKEEAERFIEYINTRIFEAFDLGMLSPIETIKLNHAIETHGVRLASQGRKEPIKRGQMSRYKLDENGSGC